jgi:hypothetical protein
MCIEPFAAALVKELGHPFLERPDAPGHDVARHRAGVVVTDLRGRQHAPPGAQYGLP